MDPEKLQFLKGELTEHFELPLHYEPATDSIIDAFGLEVVKLETGNYLMNRCVDTARTELHDAIGHLIAAALSDTLVQD